MSASPYWSFTQVAAWALTRNEAFADSWAIERGESTRDPLYEFSVMLLQASRQEIVPGEWLHPPSETSFMREETGKTETHAIPQRVNPPKLVGAIIVEHERRSFSLIAPDLNGNPVEIPRPVPSSITVTTTHCGVVLGVYTDVKALKADVMGAFLPLDAAPPTLPAPVVERTEPIDEKVFENWYRKVHIPTMTAAFRVPSRADDKKAAESAFPDKVVSWEKVRAVRKICAPPEWTTKKKAKGRVIRPS